MLDRIDHDLRNTRTALGLRTFRQELLASNIANADTPNYKARDIDFKTALIGAMGGRVEGGSLALSRTAAGHLGGSTANPYGAAIRYRTEFQAAADGNTVNMDIERSAFTENAVQIEAALTFVRERLSGLRSAIQGQ